MGKFFRQKSIILVSFLAIFFLGGLIFSGYLTLSEVDSFSPNLSFEDQDLATLATVEKIKVNHLSFSYFEHSFLPVSVSSHIPILILPNFLDDQINTPIRC